MATKLKNLRVTSVSFVDKGANPRADILLRKGTETQRNASDPVDDSRSELINLLKRFMKGMKCGKEISEEEIEKEATSFADQMYASSVEDIQQEMWDVMYALRQSFSSILMDTSLESTAKGAAMAASLNQFNTAVGGYISRWSQGKTARDGVKAEADSTAVAMMRSDQERLGELIEKAKEENLGNPMPHIAPETEPGTKGETESMNIDKSKMTAEDLKVFEALIMKYASDPDPDKPKPGNDVAKNNQDPEPAPTSEPAIEPDILKALKAQIKANNDAIEKMKEDALTSGMEAVAGKYELIGKKKEELVPVLKAMKKAGDEVFKAYIDALDAEYDMQKNSGLLDEIGKSTSGGKTGGDPNRKWIAKAQELLKSNPGMTLAKAMDQVALEDDELRAEIENQ